MRCPLLALSLLALAGCVATRGPAPSEREISLDREREGTAQVASQIRARLPLVNDPVLLAYLNELGQEIVAVTEPQPFIYRFAILRDETLNAFTIGGGHIYIHSGVLAQAGNLDELAGVLAHEIAHVRQRHVARRGEGQTAAQLATLIAVAAVALAGADPELIAISQGINVALQLKHSRAHEAEADREAIAYLVRAGYDPNGLVRFFERLVAAYPNPADIPPYLYTHPAVKERISAARVEMERTGVLRSSRRSEREAGAERVPVVEGPSTGDRRSAPAKRKRADDRLAEMQARLARLMQPVAGGSGLYARPEFERSVTDPLLDEAETEREAGRLDAADLLLARAEQLEPSDPRVALARADLAEQRRDWVTAAEHLGRAFELDPHVPLVQYRLGVAYRRGGQRSRAVFYLEQAAASFRPGSQGRRRAESEIAKVTFPFFESSFLRTPGDDEPRRRFLRGETILWEAEVSYRYAAAEELRAEWIDPAGNTYGDEALAISAERAVSAQLETGALDPGGWQLVVYLGEEEIEAQHFEIAPH